MDDGFEIKDQQNFFDFRGFLIKLLNWWPLFLICLAAALYVAYYINVRKLTVYRMSNMITVKDDQNPFFTSNTSLTFNWGGTTDKVQTAMILYLLIQLISPKKIVPNILYSGYAVVIQALGPMDCLLYPLQTNMIFCLIITMLMVLGKHSVQMVRVVLCS